MTGSAYLTRAAFKVAVRRSQTSMMHGIREVEGEPPRGVKRLRASRGTERVIGRVNPS